MTVERWCREFLGETSLEGKLAPPLPPDPRERGSWDPLPAGEGGQACGGHSPVSAEARELRPARPAGLVVAARSARTPRPGALRDRGARARLVHTFLHHELQAAELFAWALLAFPRTPRAFRRGCLAICREELEHLALYREHLTRLGSVPGDFPVRDWFWERVPTVESPRSFVALLGMGLEGANLEHASNFAHSFRAAGDVAGAELLERVAQEEERHVSFAVRWYRRWSDGVDFDSWVAALPRPLTPKVLRGSPLAREARGRAGLDDAFLDRLEAWRD